MVDYCGYEMELADAEARLNNVVAERDEILEERNMARAVNHGLAEALRAAEHNYEVMRRERDAAKRHAEQLQIHLENYTHTINQMQKCINSLEEIALDFIAKVETGKARSVKTYGAMKKYFEGLS